MTGGRGLLVVDSHGRVKLGDMAGSKFYLAEVQDGGRIVLTPAVPTREPGPLRAPLPGAGLSDGFLAQVAAVFAEKATQSGQPVKALAAEAGEPREVAQKWVDEARRRGFLAAARPQNQRPHKPPRSG